MTLYIAYKILSGLDNTTSKEILSHSCFESFLRLGLWGLEELKLLWVFKNY